jgi:hypothetical protein
MPPGYKVRYCTLLTPGWCIANAHTFFPSYRSASAISLPFKRWENVPPIPFVIPRVSTPQDVFFQCQAYGALARVRLETSHRWCGGADGMCIETNSNPDGFCVSFVERYLCLYFSYSSYSFFVYSSAYRKLKCRVVAFKSMTLWMWLGVELVGP